MCTFMNIAIAVFVGMLMASLVLSGVYAFICSTKTYIKYMEKVAKKYVEVANEEEP